MKLLHYPHWSKHSQISWEPISTWLINSYYFYIKREIFILYWCRYFLSTCLTLRNKYHLASNDHSVWLSFAQPILIALILRSSKHHLLQESTYGWVLTGEGIFWSQYAHVWLSNCRPFVFTTNISIFTSSIVLEILTSIHKMMRNSIFGYKRKKDL